MKELIDATNALARKRCPECDGMIFRPGPRGGLSQNLECVGCGVRYNITIWRGEFIFAEVIDNNGEWPEHLYPKVCQ
jgi:hypothetical protein